MKMWNGLIIIVVLFLFTASASIDGNIATTPNLQRAGPVQRLPAHPSCAGTDQWPTSMAFVHLKNDGVTDNSKLDFNKTKTTRLASEQIGSNLFRQVHHVMFSETASGHW
jgi:hypothetical protein